MLFSLSYLLTLNVFLMSLISTILYIVLLISINLLFNKKKKFVSAYLASLPSRKVLESLILPIINKYLPPAPDQHGFRPDHSTTSTLLQMITDFAMGFNQRKPPDRTICIAVLHSLPLQSVISERKTSQDLLQRSKSTSRKVNPGVPQGSKLSP